MTTPTLPANVTTVHPDDSTEFVIRLTGLDAVRYAEATGTLPSKHADPVEGALAEIGYGEAEAVCESDPSLIYFDADARLVALARDQQVGFDEVTKDDECRYSVGRMEFRVLTDEEADTAARESTQESLWAFRSSFLRSYVPALNDDRAAKAWDRMTAELSEDAQPLVEALLGDRLDECLDDAVCADGRGAALSSYDGHEREVEVGRVTFYLYRTN